MWSIYDDSSLRIVFNFIYVFLFLALFPDQIKISSSSHLLCVEPYLLLSHVTNPPFSMLGGLAKANTWVAKPEGHTFRPFLPLEAILRVVRPEDIIPNEYKASCRCEHAWSEKGRQT
jgi:hypothetical protein